MTAPYPMLVTASQWLLFGAFAGYFTATILYMSGFIGNKISHGTRFVQYANRASLVHLTGVISHALAILARWQGAGHWPTSNMYEFIGFLAFTSMVAYQVINRIFKMPLIGALVSPLGVFLIGYAYVFPPKVQPLVPALKSYWLPLHVSLAALGEGFFAVAFVAAWIYLLRVRGLELKAEAEGKVDASRSEREKRWERRTMEVLFYSVFVMIGFTLLALVMRYTGQEWVFGKVTYHLPPLIGPAGAAPGDMGNLFGLPLPLVSVPETWKGKNWNSLLYSLFLGWLIYALLRRFWAKGQPIGDTLATRVSGDPETLDEISYRSVAIGYPVFTLGGLIFAMLWAKEAWGRYWFWDPKETWAFIAWLVYTAYLHFRISHGWEGRRSAWIAVVGFGVILFTLIGVNLLIVGLHSYAGGDM